MPCQNHERQSAEHQLACQRNNEWRDVQIRNENALNHADGYAERQNQNRRKPRIQPAFYDENAQNRAAECKNRADRQVDVTGQNTEEHTDREQNQIAVLQNQVGDIHCIENITVRQNSEQERNDGQCNNHAVLPHVAR